MDETTAARLLEHAHILRENSEYQKKMAELKSDYPNVYQGNEWFESYKCAKQRERVLAYVTPGPLDGYHRTTGAMDRDRDR